MFYLGTFIRDSTLILAIRIQGGSDCIGSRGLCDVSSSTYASQGGRLRDDALLKIKMKISSCKNGILVEARFFPSLYFKID